MNPIQEIDHWNNSLKFKEHIFLTEKIAKSDIIDAYIIMSMPSPDDPANAFTADEISKQHSRTIINEIESIIVRELRHTDNQTSTWKTLTDYGEELKGVNYEPFANDYDYRDIINYLRRESKKIFGVVIQPKQFIEGLEDSMGYLQKTYSNNYKKQRETNVIELAEASGLPWTLEAIEKVFKNWEWDTAYGGQNWATITNQAIKLQQGSQGDFFKRLDRFIDYVHNTGHVANKFQGYEEGWLNFILDLKAQALNIRELIPYASRDVQKLFKDSSWRQMLNKIPGMGAAETNDATIAVIQKYMDEFVKRRYNKIPDPYEDDWDEYGIHTPMAQLAGQLGKKRLAELVEKELLTNKQFKKIASKYADFLEDDGWLPEEIEPLHDVLSKEFYPEEDEEGETGLDGEGNPMPKFEW